MSAGVNAGRSAESRRERLKAVYGEARQCERCELAATRTQVVFGAGNADADVVLVGEAPGADEDAQGIPFVGRSGQLLERLLGEAGLGREEVFILNVLKCRPPGNRDPRSEEIDACRPWLELQLELIEPRLVCPLGNFATKLLRGSNDGITKVHGRPEIRTVAGRRVRLYPLFHPAAALRSTGTLGLLRADIMRLPDLAALPVPGSGGGDPAGGASAGQLGLFGG